MTQKRTYRRFEIGRYSEVGRAEWDAFMRENGGDPAKHLGLMFEEEGRGLACFRDGPLCYIERSILDDARS